MVLYKILFCLHPFLYLLVSWAWWDWPLTWLSSHRPSVLWHCWLGHLTCNIISEMTYNVSSRTLNPTIPYHVFQDDVSVLNMATESRSWWVRNGYGCHAVTVFADNSTDQTSSELLPTAAAPASFVATTIVGCIISYEYVEVLHAGLQCLFVASIVVISVLECRFYDRATLCSLMAWVVNWVRIFCIIY